MEKFFNTAGPIKKNMHYYISSFERFDYKNIENLINQEKYFILHAPRQTGKTSALFEMMERINSESIYDCLYANIEPAQASRADVGSGIRTICECIASAASIYLKNNDLKKWVRANKREIEPQQLLSSFLQYWAVENDKPIILFLDEVDALVGDTLISLLRQLRAGYNQRPYAFPQSLIMCGVRDIRDYRIHTKDNEIITGGSAFNIKAKSLTISNFSFEECKNLYLQHTIATGQKFEESIFDKLWSDTKGQPWLVNSLGFELTWENETLRENRERTITLKDYKQAREILIYSRATHLDQLTDKLQEKRVNRVISKILKGDDKSYEFRASDLEYLVDLGLISRVKGGKVEIANDIYKETIPRELTWGMQSGIVNQEQEWYINQNNRVDMSKLLTAFQQFFRVNADSWIEKFEYKEAGPQLILQAFLQRLINGGGRINREYGLGRKRTDILVEWPVDKNRGFLGDNIQQIVIETKILYGKLETTIEKGLEQTLEYGDIVGASEHHLIIFNRRKEVKWEDKIWSKKELYGGREVTIWGC